jgi:hypothetical protein
MGARCGECGAAAGPRHVDFCPGRGAFISWRHCGDEPAASDPHLGDSPPDQGSLALRVSVSPAKLVVDPDSTVEAQITVHNEGTRIEKVVVTAKVKDERQDKRVPWLKVVTPEVSIYPGTDAHAVLQATHPRTSEYTAGTVEYQVEVRSKVDPGVLTRTGGGLTIGAYRAVAAELSSEQLRSRRRARCHIWIGNTGNTEETVELAHAAMGGVRVSVIRMIRVKAGFRREVSARLTSPIRLFGVPVDRSFAIDVRSDALTTSPTLRGTITHLALLPRWMATATLTLACILVAGLGVTWAVGAPGFTQSGPNVAGAPTTTTIPTTTEPTPKPSPTPSPTPTQSPTQSPTPSPRQSPRPSPTPSPTQTPTTPTRSSAAVGCRLLTQTLAQVRTDQDLIDAGQHIRRAINRIDESPTDDDAIILYYSSDVRNLLNQKPDNAVGRREGWVRTERISLENLYNACVGAGYITR